MRIADSLRVFRVLHEKARGGTLSPEDAARRTVELLVVDTALSQLAA